MNTISTNYVRPYATMTNNALPQPINTNPAPINFKNVIDGPVISKKQKTLSSILSYIKDKFGLGNKKSLIESLSASIDRLLRENNNLLNQNQKLRETIQSLRTQLESTQSQLDNMMRNVNNQLARKEKEHAGEILEKNKVIADLQQYAGLAKVKSIKEVGVIMPKKLISVLNEYKGNQEAAAKSMLEYLMTGKGQVAALKQAELSNIIAAARRECLFEVPEVAKASEGMYIPYDAVSNDMYLIENVLKVSDEGAYIISPSIKKQVKINAESLLKAHGLTPIGKEQAPKHCDRILKEVEDFHKNIKLSKEKLAKEGWECTGKTIVDYNPKDSYCTFVNKKDGTTWELPLIATANGWYGVGKMTDATGKVISDLRI